MMIHSTNNTIRPMMIQVMAVEDIRGLLGGRMFMVGRGSLWRGGGGGKRALHSGQYAGERDITSIVALTWAALTQAR
jgi:hypothetical protein